LISQQHIIDSLELQLKNSTHLKTKVETLVELGHFYSMAHPEQGIEKLKDAIALNKELKDSFLLGSAFGNLGKNYISLGKDSLAFINYDKAEIIFKKIDSTVPLSKLKFNKGILYSERSNYEKASQNIEGAYELFKKENDTLLMAYASTTLGYFRIYLGAYAKSMDDFLRGKKLFEEIEQEHSIFYATAEGNLGILYQRLNNFDKALSLHQKALDIFEKNGNEFLMATQYEEMGNIYQKKSEFEKSLKNYQSSYQINKKIKNIGKTAISLSNIGVTYRHLKNYREALKYFDSAITINKNLNDYGKLAINFHNKGDSYIGINEFHLARQCFDTSLTYAKKNADNRLIYEAKYGISFSASKEKDYRTAYSQLDEANTLKDSILSENKRDEITRLQAKYEYDKEKAVLQANFAKDKALDQANIQRQVLLRNTAIGGGIVGVLTIVFGFLLVKRKKEAELNEKLSRSRLRAIQAQLNPHFIFNTLNSINDYIQKNNDQAASGFLIRFSKMMRSVLDFSNAQEISLSEELEFLENYINLEQHRLNNGFNYTIKVDEQIDQDNTFVPPSILQPFVENSIWHGLANAEKDTGRLWIEIKEEGHQLTYIIQDNGSGMKSEEPPYDSKHKSFGSGSVQQRLDLWNELRGTASGKIETTALEHGVKVVLNIAYTLDTDA